MTQEIIVYSGLRCKPCEAVKGFLKESGFSYIEKNIHLDKQARQELLAMGMKSIPVTIIGDRRIEGFDREKIAEALGVREAT